MKAISEVSFELSELSELLTLGNFDDRQKRVVYGFLARKLGAGGPAAVASALHVSPAAVRRGLAEISREPDAASPPAPSTRTRRRKSTAETQSGIPDAMEDIV